MSNFHQAVALLIEHINNAQENEVRFTQELAEKPPFAFIDWLEAQPIFPKFYWQSRDTREEVVALGQLYTFTDPEPAYAILGSGQRVWGGRSFDGRTEKNRYCMASLFFLPKIELVRFDQRWTLVANVVSEKHRTISALNQVIEEVPVVRALQNNIDKIVHTPNEEHWQRLVDKVLDGIEQQDFKKVVLARRTSLKLDHSISAAELLKASYAQNHHSFHFLLSLDSKHSFMGSTPERLYLRQQNELQTEALAGTIGRGKNAAQDLELANWLSQDIKNLNENQYVVDDIVERLSPHSEQVSVEQEARLVRLRKVQHLKRAIRAELKPGINGIQLLEALQPTAAVAGLPRKEAFDFITENEPFARGWYAGSMGYFSHEKAEFCVAIRSALILDKEVQLFAGAGIVPGSIAEHEWQELDKKMSTLLGLITDQLPLGVAS